MSTDWEQATRDLAEILRVFRCRVEEADIILHHSGRLSKMQAGEELSRAINGLEEDVFRFGVHNGVRIDDL